MTTTRRAALLASLALPLLPRGARAADTVRLGQATPALSFLPIWAARAYGSFAAAGLGLEWAAIPGGDPAALAALDAGDIDLAAVGSDTALAAIAKQRPFLMIYDLMAKMSLDLVVSPALLKRAAVGPADPLARRIGALRHAVIGVSAVGGAQDRTVRWIAAQGGLGAADVQVALVGGPPAIQAALAHGRIDGFVLSPPEPGLALAGGYGVTLIDPARDFPALRGLPNLVLVARSNPDAATTRRILGATGALNAGARQVLADPDGAAARIGAQFFPKIPPAILRDGVNALRDGIGGDGRFTSEGIAALIRFTSGAGIAPPRDRSFWTNRFIA